MRRGGLLIVRLLDADEVRARAAELLRLQHAAYAVEADLIGDDRIPALSETESDLVGAGVTWLTALDGGHLVGAVGYTVAEGVVELDRLVVDPDRHREGIGVTLVRAALEAAPRAIVATGRDNHPARALYERLGFGHVADVEVLPGLWVSRYSRPA